MKKLLLAAVIVEILWSAPAWGQNISVTAPTAGSEWLIGNHYSITWNSSGITTPLCIKLRPADQTSATPVMEIATGLTANGSYSWTVPSTVAAGDYKIRVRTIAGTPLFYGDSPLFHVTPPPTPGSTIPRRDKPTYADLAVTSVVVSPDPPRARKDMITITATVKNQGHKAAANLEFPCSLVMDISSVDGSGQKVKGDLIHAIPNYTYNIPDLAPNQSIQISKTVTLRFAGRHCVSGIIDTEGFHAPGEEDSTNNRYEFFFNALEPPPQSDLALTDVTLTADGQLVLQLTNKGAAIPAADFDTSYLMIKVYGENDRSFKMTEIDPTGLLKKGSSGFWVPQTAIFLNFTCPAKGYKGILLQPGQSMTFEVIADYNVRISDSNRDNNKRTVTLTRLK